MQILTSVTGLSPIEVEKQVTYPVEIEMSSLPGLIESRSISQFGLSAITLVFEDDMDVYFARQLVLERLGIVAEELPEGVTPEMGPVSTGLGEIYQYTIEGEDYSPMERRNYLLEFIKHLCRPMLEWAVKHRAVVVVIAVVALVFSLALFPFLGTEFVPPLEEGAIAMQAIRIPTVALEGTDDMLTAIEREAMKTPEVTTVVSRTGRAEVATDPMQPYFSDIYIMLKPLSEWRDGFRKKDIVNEIRGHVEKIPGMNYSFNQPIALLLLHGIGSEVQRPLATVVVGGLVTSTLVTLIVLPTIYGWFEEKPEAVEI